MKKLITTILLLTAIVFGGCQKTAIEGKVIDGFGNPVKDAIIKIEGTQFTTQTNGSGEYSVGYVPGDITVLVTKPGFTDASFTVKIATETTFPAEAKTIYEIPKESGIFLMQDGMYKALSRGEVSSKKYSDSDGLFMGVYYEYYISFDEKKVISTKKQSDSLIFFDNDPNEQTLLGMYEDHYGQHVALVRTVKTATGIIFSMQDFKDEVQLVDETFQNFNNGITIRTSNLAIGDYVFVQYQKRRSNPIQGNAYVLRIAD